MATNGYIVMLSNGCFVVNKEASKFSEEFPNAHVFTYVSACSVVRMLKATKDNGARCMTIAEYSRAFDHIGVIKES